MDIFLKTKRKKIENIKKKAQCYTCTGWEEGWSGGTLFKRERIQGYTGSDCFYTFTLKYCLAML